MALGSYKWADNQEWEIVPVAPISDGKSYALRAAHSGKALTATASGMVQKTDSVLPGQVWKAVSLGAGWWAFEQGGRRLSVAADSLLDGAPLALVPDTGSATRWMVVDDGSGVHQIVNGCSGKSLDVDGGATATEDGAKVMQFRNWDTKNQRWNLREVQGSGIADAPRGREGVTISVHGRVVRLDGRFAGELEASDLSGRRLAVWKAAGASIVPGTVRGVVRIRCLPDGAGILAVLP